MATTTIEALIAAMTFVMSVGTSMFISGTRWGRVETKLTDLEKNKATQDDMNGIRDRLSRIEGMFTLTLKDGERRR